MEKKQLQKGAMLLVGIVLSLMGGGQWLRTQQGSHGDAAVQPPSVQQVDVIQQPISEPKAANTKSVEQQKAANTKSVEQPPSVSTKSVEQPKAVNTKSVEQPKAANTKSVEQPKAVDKTVSNTASSKGVIQTAGTKTAAQQTAKAQVPAARPWHRSNLERHWTKHRNEFPEFQSQEEYGDWAVEFFTNPPEGTLIKVREDGRLFYHQKSNTFGATTLDGVPKTLFRPDRGMDYWRRQ